MGHAAPASVLMIGNFLSRHGRKRSPSEDLAEQLAARGWEVVCTSTEVNRTKRMLAIARAIWTTRRTAPVANIDVYSGLAFLWAEFACWFMRFLGRPYVLTLHGGGLPCFARRRPRRVGRLLRSAAAVTSPSAYLAHDLAALRPDIQIIPNAMAVKTYMPAVRTKARPRLVWVRSFHYVYNPSLAIETVRLLESEFRDIELTMVGPDEGDGSFEAAVELARALDLESRIRYTGGVHRAEVLRYLQQADIFLNTSDVDNAPVSVVEAMACGLCVISTNVGGIPHLVEDGRDALLVPSGDPDAMARKVRQVLLDPELARSLSENAIRRASAYDWPQILPRWEALLLSVAGQHSCDRV